MKGNLQEIFHVFLHFRDGKVYKSEKCDLTENIRNYSLFFSFFFFFIIHQQQHDI